MPDVAYALVWLLILNPGYGPLNLTLSAFGLATYAWLQEPFTARASLVVMWYFQLGEGLDPRHGRTAASMGEVVKRRAAGHLPTYDIMRLVGKEVSIRQASP